jgi:hypothetical protein
MTNKEALFGMTLATGIPTASGRGEWQAGFRSLGDAWADTTTAHGRLILTVLGGLAEFERDAARYFAHVRPPPQTELPAFIREMFADGKNSTSKGRTTLTCKGQQALLQR